MRLWCVSLSGHLSPTETDGDMLGYDLYSSALADILSEPTMQPPICVGLYAQWGSGKSFLLKKLEGEDRGQHSCSVGRRMGVLRAGRAS